MIEKKTEKTFGETVRLLRDEQRIGLRKLAERVGMSPTYLSKVERGEFPPPGEEKVKSIAQALGQNEDELLALAGRVSSDLNKIIRRQPREMADFLRSASGLSAPDLDKLRRDAEKRKRLKERGGI
jgi:transcriptional regulator with XRE-family HTH domain